MKIDQILTELLIFARERGADDDPDLGVVVKAAERHLGAILALRARRARVAHRPECERCEAPSSSGILCWNCLSQAPVSIRHAFRNARGLDGIRAAAEKVRTWIQTSSPNEQERRHAA